jgi:hypothetical protein
MRNMGYRLYFSGSTCLCAQLRIAALRSQFVTSKTIRICPTAVAALPMRSSAGIICAHRRRLYAFVQQLCLCAIGRIAVELVVTNLMAKEKGVPMRYAPYLVVSQP